MEGFRVLQPCQLHWAIHATHASSPILAAFQNKPLNLQASTHTKAHGMHLQKLQLLELLSGKHACHASTTAGQMMISIHPDGEYCKWNGAESSRHASAQQHKLTLSSESSPQG
jgi:hypothetical protein